MKLPKLNKILIALISLFLLRIILAFIVWHPDVANHIDWGIRFWQYGPRDFYSQNVWSFTWPNQPPGTIIMFALIRKLFEFTFGIFWQINVSIPIFPSQVITFFESNLYPALLKLPSILSDFGIAYLIYKILLDWGSKKKAIIGAIVFLVNPVIWYNSAIWGQTDSVINFFGLLAFYWLFRKKLTLAFGSIIFCLFLKISLIIFVPIFLLVAYKRYKLSNLIKSSSVPIAAILFISFIFSGKNPLPWLIDIYSNKVMTQQLQVITANAFNFWVVIAGIHERPHSLPFLGLTYQYWGYILFFSVFIPILYSVWKSKNEKQIVWALALTAFSSWLLLTNMHERYLYPLFPYFTILVVSNFTLFNIYVITSIVGLLNLYNFWWIPHIDLIEKFLSFNNRFMPRIFGIVNTIIFLAVFKKFLRLLSRSKI